MKENLKLKDQERISNLKPYPEYKSSEVDWLDRIPEHWDSLKINWVFNIYNGSTPSSNVEKYWGGDIAWATPNDLGNLHKSEIFKTERYITEEGYKSCGTTLVDKGSIILSTRAPIGHIAIAGTEICTNQGCKALELQSENVGKYFYYQLRSIKEVLRALGSATTFQELSTSKLKTLKIVYPPIDEQRAIVNFLDIETSRIDKLIKKQERLIELLEEKRTGLISHAVTKGLDPDVEMKDSGVEWWGRIPKYMRIDKLKYAANVIDGDRGNEYPNERDLQSEGIPFLSTKSISNNELDYNKSRFIKKDKFSKLGRGKLQAGDLIITVRGTIGSIAMFRGDEFETGFINAQMMILRPLNSIMTEYLKYITLSGNWFSQLDYSRYGTAQQQLTNELLRNLSIPVPPMRIQQEIVNYLDQKTEHIDHLIENITKTIKRLKEYRTSLISAAVTGKIDVRDQL